MDDHAMLTELASHYANAASAVANVRKYGTASVQRVADMYRERDELDRADLVDAQLAKMCTDPVGYHYGREASGRVTCPTAWSSRLDADMWDPSNNVVDNLRRARQFIDMAIVQAEKEGL